jgi:hypothetical protein
LNSHSVNYLVIGGFAVAIHGHPRYTKDIEIWIEPSPTNAIKILTVLRDFEFESLGLTADDFVGKTQVIQLGYPPNRIDLLTFAHGIDFETSYNERISVVVDDVQVNFVGIAQLRTNKKATGRYQDLADLEALDALE